MSVPFEATSFGGMTLKNRFVRSATWEGMADDDGTCSARIVEVVAELAQNELGLIISSHAFVSPEGRSAIKQIAVYEDKFVDGLRQTAQAAHNCGSKILLQLGHAGVRSATSLTGLDAIGPSDSANGLDGPARAMKRDEIDRTVRAFVDAATRARIAGFDGVQLHLAHSYLLSQFLSPYYNKRTDEYGGTVENRARIILRIYEQIRNRLGEEYPILAKINSEDFLDGGLTVGDMLQTARMLEDAGIDGIELSGGSTDPVGHFNPVREGTPLTKEEEVYYLDAARQFKQRIGVPLILVGGIRSYEVAGELVKSGLADYIALCRPLIREPDLVARWKTGDFRKSQCGSCAQCLGPIRGGEGMYCVPDQRQQTVTA